MNLIFKKCGIPLLFFLLMLILIAGSSCVSRKSAPASILTEKEISLIERVEGNRFRTDAPSAVKIDTFPVGNQQRKALLQRTNSAVTCPEIPVHPGAKLRFGLSFHSEFQDWPDGGVEVAIILSHNGEEHRLFESIVDAESRIGVGSAWNDRQIDLSEYAGSVCGLTFRTGSGSGTYTGDNWVAWDSPVVMSEGRRLALRSPEATNVILITADTLRADYLGCYGKPDIQTPNLDKLAEEGTLFENHYAQCNSTLPSHASILSSLYLKDHGIYDNSTSLPADILTLPIFLRLSGFQTAAFVSAGHLNPEISGLDGGFDHFSLSPSFKIEDGKRNQRRAKETNQDVFQWLAKNREFRFFLWIHYFDPHTPYRPPSPYDRLYYEGNPKDPASKSMQPLIKKRMEHLGWLEKKIERLKAGFLDEDLLDRFQTSLKFRWGVLTALNKDPTNLKRNATLDEVIAWASGHLDRYLTEGTLDPQFQSWLIHFAETLKIEKEQLQKSSQAWLSEITDYDYAVSQYKGEITYMDAQIGKLMERLENLGIKDSTLLVFTADHGESMGEHDIFFAHRGLYLPVIRVPLIVRGPGVEKGARISIQTESVDIFPSLLEMIDLPIPPSLRGKSLAKMIRKGRAGSSQRDVSYSEHTHGYQVAARTEEFSYFETLSSSELYSILRENALLSKGEILLFRSDDLGEKRNIAKERPEIVRTFNRLVHDWLEEKKPRSENGTRTMDPETLEMLKALGYIR